MSLELFPCQLVSWREAYLLAKGLAKSVKASGFCPDLVVSIGRGGLCASQDGLRPPSH